MWVDELKRQVENSSLGAVAKAMGVSKAMISLVVNGKYKGNMANVKSLVESVFMGYTVTCPVLGQIPKHKCTETQNTKHVSSSPNAIRLWKACRSDCTHSQLKERLSTPVKLSIEQSKTAKDGVSIEHRERQYDPYAVCARLERQAKTDSGADLKTERTQALYIELLKCELIALGNRYNRLRK